MSITRSLCRILSGYVSFVHSSLTVSTFKETLPKWSEAWGPPVLDTGHTQVHGSKFRLRTVVDEGHSVVPILDSTVDTGGVKWRKKSTSSHLRVDGRQYPTGTTFPGTSCNQVGSGRESRISTPMVSQFLRGSSLLYTPVLGIPVFRVHK